jgi:hypothetical protein
VAKFMKEDRTEGDPNPRQKKRDALVRVVPDEDDDKEEGELDANRNRTQTELAMVAPETGAVPSS